MWVAGTYKLNCFTHDSATGALRYRCERSVLRLGNEARGDGPHGRLRRYPTAYVCRAGLERTRTARTLDGHHLRAPWAVGTPSSVSVRAMSERPRPRA
jgi:hypothetical protein